MNKPRVWCVLLAVLVVTLMVAATATAQLKISGYTQIRYEETDADDDYDFDVKRSRIKVAGPVNDDGTEIKLQIDLGKLDDDDNVQLKDAIITHPLSPEWDARLGFSDMLFGYDVAYSSSKRLLFERAKVTRSLFPGEKDTGLYLTYSPEDASAGTPKVILGFSDDLEDIEGKIIPDGDLEDSQAFIAGLRWGLPNKGEAGISFMSASREETAASGGADFDDSVWGAHVRYNSTNNFAFQGEYMDGERRGVDVNGWYGTLEFTPNDSDATVFYRYDTYDDGDADDYDRHTLGVAMDVGSQSRVTFQYEDIDDEGASDNNLGIQWQVKYPAK